MSKLKRYLVPAIGLLVLAGMANLTGAGHALAQAVQDVLVVNTPDQPVPVSGGVAVVNTPDQPVPVSGDVAVVNTPDQPVPVSGSVAISNTPSVTLARVLASDARSFSLPPDPNIAFEFAVPSNVVLTDVVLTLNAPSVATTIFVADFSNKTYVFESVGSSNSTFAGNRTGRAAIHLQSGLQGPLRVGLTCNNIGGNSCSGALMWSGFQP